ncbi:MAG: YggT family protein [Chloroflexi bacterium]|nr:YggT family protein [Chloroflexota bacterium]
MLLFVIARAVSYLLQILMFAIVCRALLSWFMPTVDNPIMRILYEVTEPILAPLRRVIPLIGAIDITPIVALFLLQILQQWLARSLT